jgi:hypothetical protein
MGKIKGKEQRRTMILSVAEVVARLAKDEGLTLFTADEEDEDDLIDDTDIGVHGRRKNLFEALSAAAKDGVEGGVPVVPEKPLMPISQIILPSISMDFMTAARNELYRALRTMVLYVGRGQSKKTVTWTQDQCADIVNLLFHDMMGTPANTRISDYIATYESQEPATQQFKASQKAKVLARTVTYEPMKKFFVAYKEVARQIASEKGKYSYLYRMQTSIELLKKYNHLRELGSATVMDPSLIAFLAAEGFTVSKGVGIQSLVLQYLSSALELEQGKIQNILQEAVCVDKLAETFGNGVLLLLPIGVMRQ